MRYLDNLIIPNLFWIPIIIGGGLATLFFGWAGSGNESVLGLGSFLDSLIALILIIIGVWALDRMPGKILRFLIGFGLIGLGLYILINVMGVV